MKRRADFRRPENFWEEKGDIVLAVARYMGLPFYEMNEDMPKGISFCQVRYRTRKEKEKTKWLTDKPLKKKQEMLALCLWTIFPVGIYPTKRSLDPKEQRYGYLVRISDKKGQTLCSAMIEVRWDGAVVTQTVDIGKERTRDMQEEIPIGLQYPKVIFAKLNRCMARFFWGDLWCGPTYAAWYRPDSGIAVYMGNIEGHQKTWGNGLKSLLESPYGDAAAVLFAYSCFSVLKPWFDTYPKLDGMSPYFKVKKELPLLIALNVRSQDMQSAEQLAELCCGAFQRMGDGKFPVNDGVVIQRSPKQRLLLSEHIFEKKVLQSASVLWVNRKLTKELAHRNAVLDIEVPSGYCQVDYPLDSAGMVGILAWAVSVWYQNMQIGMMKADRKRQAPIGEKTLRKLQQIEKRYYFEFQEVEIANELESLQQNDFTEDLVRHFSMLRTITHREIIENTSENVDAFAVEVDQEFSDCLREMRKIHKENCVRENFIVPYYKSAQRKVQGVDGIEPTVAAKITFLWASIKFFITTLSEAERDWIERRIFSALVSFAQQQKESWSAGGYLEEYLIKEIRGGHCARIRGKGSDSEGTTLWYDPYKQEFLLLSESYFGQVCPHIKEPQITRKIFEQKLTEEGLLLTVKRGGQIRRTFEVKIRIGGGSNSVLKIPLEKLREGFREDTQVQKVLQQLYADDTPLRTD